MMLKISDDRDRDLLFSTAPRRVVSLVPSDTFSVAALGFSAALVGRTDYCELPAAVVSKLPSVGGTKNPRLDVIAALEPDLILANQEENTRGDLEALAQRGFRIYVAFPKRVADGISHLARLARIFRAEREGRDLVRRAYDELRAADKVGDRDVRYPRVSMSEVNAHAPELVLLPDEPHPFSEADAAVFRAQDTPAAARGAVVRIDGKDLCWYGARSVEGIARMRALVAPWQKA
jgi:ABC-type hemin transport system substrate-binding protein